MEIRTLDPYAYRADSDFVDDVRSCLKEDYFVESQAVKGLSLSNLKDSLCSRMRGAFHVDRLWSIPGPLASFEYVLQNEGFKVEYGKNRRGQRCLVVFES